MAAKRLAGVVAILLTTTLTGCCEWCKNHCDACRAPAPAVGYAPGGACYTPPPCCTPAPTCCTPGYAPAPAAPAQWQRPAYGQPCCQ
jgi:hypothetical protein